MQLKVVTLNCWGLKFVAKRREERMKAIAHELQTHYSDNDIIALQEIWVFDDFIYARKTLQSLFPHSKFFHSAALGAGLAIFSKHPIIDTNLKPYALNNSPLHILEGDWIVGKAAASAVIRHPLAGDIEVFNTHSVQFCAGFGEGPEYTQSHRISQAWEISKLMRSSLERGRQVIAMGDFNSTPDSAAMNVVYYHGLMRDAWSELHGNLLPDVPVEDDEKAIEEFGVTCNSPRNTWSAGKRFDERSTRWRGKRLDYVLYRENENNSHHQLVCTSSKVVFVNSIPDTNISFSDHYGVAAVFRLDPTKTKREFQVTKNRQFYREIAGYLRTYRGHALSTSRHQMVQFGICLALAVGLVVGTSFQPKTWLNWIFPLCTFPVSFYGATMLYTGFIYGRWEVAAIDNLSEEMQLAAGDAEEEVTVNDETASTEDAEGQSRRRRNNQNEGRQTEENTLRSFPPPPTGTGESSDLKDLDREDSMSSEKGYLPEWAGKTIQEMESDGDVMHCGYLFKRGGGTKSKAWRKRWFVLSIFGLAYFKANTPRERPRGVIGPLFSFEVTDAGITPGAYAFNLNPKSDAKHKRCYSLYAKSEEERKEWTAKISQVQLERRRTVTEIERVLDGTGAVINGKDLQIYKQRILGRGASGDVLEGTWNQTTEVAVKQLQDSSRISPSTLIAFYKEVSTLYSVRHPEVVKMYGFCKKDETLCLVTELVKGGTLDQIIDAGDTVEVLPVLDIIAVLLSITRAMICLHSKGVVHRDLKPSSIMIDDWSKRSVKVCGFGLSADVQNSSNRAGAAYIAPEMQGTKPTDYKVDVFAFGIIAWELMMQKRAFAHLKTRNEVDDAIFRNRRPELSETNLLYSVISKCWNGDPQHRSTFDQCFNELNTIKNTINKMSSGPGQISYPLYSGYTPSNHSTRRETRSDINSVIVAAFDGQKYIDWPKFIEVVCGATGEELELAEELKFCLQRQNRAYLEDYTKFITWFTPVVGRDTSYSTGYTLRDIVQVVSRPWFHGVLDANRSKDILHQQEVGAFLVRFSSQPKVYTLSLRFRLTCSHWRITSEKMMNGMLYTMGTRTYKSLDELIERHMVEPLDGDEEGQPVQYVLEKATDRNMTHHYTS
ncbi:hypothetical protein PROFUN_14401 [Planoprotostelium fungivorum]|uniref:SH2 domain-containing protein n=1 Tax=Planoprotostelium fungivorum TaxID=1890364 RepID=A0A2P6N0B7_9EUKA|nr:hypothetical protein PROFUN_14401 [Planoprotostelium fungivorum]